MPQLKISDIIEIAKKELNKQVSQMENMRQQLTCESFKSLFLIRAEQAMVERKNFGKFIIDDNNRQVINLMYSYIMHQDCALNTYVGIIINGKYGCGKSVLIEAFCNVLNDLSWSEKSKIEIVHAIELAEQIKNVGVIPYSRKPLCIQDIGKEKKEIKDFGTVMNPIGDLLAIRAEYGALTFGSTNMDLEMFRKDYKDYISKRICEHVNLVLLPGEDRRPNYSINQPK